MLSMVGVMLSMMCDLRFRGERMTSWFGAKRNCMKTLSRYTYLNGKRRSLMGPLPHLPRRDPRRQLLQSSAAFAHYPADGRPPYRGPGSRYRRATLHANTRRLAADGSGAPAGAACRGDGRCGSSVAARLDGRG